MSAGKFFCTGPVSNSFGESSVVAVVHSQTDTPGPRPETGQPAMKRSSWATVAQRCSLTMLHSDLPVPSRRRTIIQSALKGLRPSSLIVELIGSRCEPVWPPELGW